MNAIAGFAALSSAALIFGGCALSGPLAVSNGRPTYNEVINQTEDEQLLAMVVRQRYDETFGMLAVASVTASLRVAASVGANVAIGPGSSYEGNLVPLSAGIAYEENPTISYVPLRREKFLQLMLAPISAEQALLLMRLSSRDIGVLRVLLRRANGLVNPLYSPGAGAGAFDRLLDLWTRLREAGKLDIVRSADGQFTLYLHDHTDEGSRADVSELLRILGVGEARERAAPIALPLRFSVGAARGDGVDLETPSALEVVDAAAQGVEVPNEHLVDGVARPPAATAPQELIEIHSAAERPDASTVAVKFKGWWFFVDERDSRSKRGFIVLRALIGLLLDAGTSGQAVPVLTVPVSR